MSNEAVELLRSIDATLKELLALSKARKPAGTQAPSVNLDDPKADEKIRIDPRDWLKMGGESFKGRQMSQCSSAFLDEYANSMDYFAGKNDEKGEKDSRGNPKSKWDRLSAARARAWADAIRSGKVKAVEPEAAFDAPGGEW